MSNIRPLSEAYAKVARTELNETPERIAHSLEAIKQWLKLTPHIKSRTDDQFLVGFFRGCKYSLEKVKEKLDMFYTVRSKLYQRMANRDPFDEKTLDLLRGGIGIPLSIKTHLAGDPVLGILQMSQYDPNHFSVEDLFDYGIKTLDILLDEDQFTTCGITLIIDFHALTMAHILQFTPLVIKQTVALFQQSAPIRIKDLHFINVPSAGLFIFQLLKSLVGEKIKKRIFIHHSPEELHKRFPKQALPEEYGGNAGSVKKLIADWEELVLSKQHLLVNNGNYGVDETKRPIKTNNSDWTGGSVEGSFRKLTVD